MNKDKFLNSGLLEQYVLRLTNPEEDRIVEQHIQAFPEVAEEARQLKQAMDAYVSERVVPSPTRKVVEQNNFSALNSASGQAVFNWSLLFALIFAGTTFYLFQARQTDQQRIDKLEAEFAALQEYYDNDHRHETEQLSILGQTQDPRTVSTILKATDNEQSFLLYYFNDATQKSWLDVTQVHQFDDQLTYQVWAKTANEAILLGAIPSNERKLITLPYVEDATNIMITSAQEALSDVSEADHILFSADL